AKTQMPRGQRRHLAHRVLESDHLLVARVVAEHAGEGAVRTWMRFSEGQGAVRRVRARVAPDRDPWLAHDEAHVVLAHRGMDDVARPFVLPRRAAGPLEWTLPRRLRELRDGLAAVLRAVSRPCDHDAIPRATGLGRLVTDPP